MIQISKSNFQWKMLFSILVFGIKNDNILHLAQFVFVFYAIFSIKWQNATFFFCPQMENAILEYFIQIQTSHRPQIFIEKVKTIKMTLGC